MKTGIELITIKRESHPAKGFDSEHDKQHTPMDFINAAKAYMYGERYSWPFDRQSFKLGSREENLANAGSMIAAAIDRLQSQDNFDDLDLSIPCYS
ncbi:MAG TPA: hypothetical protein VGN20_19185 [Mucilaginibacter sp.]|jgi:hypothetical protein